MARFVICCDLTGPGHDYRGLRARLGELGATPALDGVWLLEIHATAVTIRIDLTQHLHPDDRILVARVDGDIAWRNPVAGGGADAGFDPRRARYRKQLRAIYALCDRPGDGRASAPDAR